MKLKLIIAIFLMTSFTFAQKKITDIALPTSPAASVLGVQPSATLTPKSFKALEAAVYSNFSNEEDGLTIPNDFGLEFMPYWFKDHGMTITEYLEPKFKDQIFRNSAFSLASTQNFMLEDGTATKSVGWGYRTSVFFNTKNYNAAVLQDLDKVMEISNITSGVKGNLMGYYANIPNIDTQHKYLTALKPDLKTFLDTNTAIVLSQNEYDILFSEIYAKAVTIPINPAKPADFFDGVNEVINEKLTNEGYFTTKFEDLKKKMLKKEGFGVDIAYAMLLNFPSNDFEFSIVPRQSAWLAPSYTFNSKNNTTAFKGTGVLRYEWYNKSYYTKYFPTTEVYKNNFDYGAAISMDYNKFSLQLEGTGRSSSSLEEVGTDANGETLYKKNSNSDFQYIATLSYRLTDQIAFSYQFGNSFKPIFTPDVGTLISLLSLNFGFGGPTTSSVN
ncbi:hypothetical protein ACLI09_03390 [Flavobacterium sp. RHBU_24]|uniref:hypothetical protein n=1 Tax=Flavobacterium sp. RHBU_24 TaxID=3391185 RepID=UPI003984F011